jgi:hypothetical protein
MAVKIIKAGALPSERIYTHTCHHCQTLYEFQEKDAKLTSDQRDGNFLNINCPLCNSRNSVAYGSTSRWPEAPTARAVGAAPTTRGGPYNSLYGNDR